MLFSPNKFAKIQVCSLGFVCPPDNAPPHIIIFEWAFNLRIALTLCCDDGQSVL